MIYFVVVSYVLVEELPNFYRAFSEERTLFVRVVEYVELVYGLEYPQSTVSPSSIFPSHISSSTASISLPHFLKHGEYFCPTSPPERRAPVEVSNV